MSSPFRRTKVVATLGPALDRPGQLERMLDAGADVLRVNLSHARPAEHVDRVNRARAHKPGVAVLADLGGPKLRLGDLGPEGLKIEAAQTLVLGAGGVPVADPSFFDRVRPGDPIYLADGTVHLEAKAVERDRVITRVVVGAHLRTRNGINLPSDSSSLPCLTERDAADLRDMHLLQPDYVALSYVRNESDVLTARQLCSVPLIAKIEKQQALDRIDAILETADAIMVARGDLGVEMPIEKVPAAQKRIIRAANKAGRPVITATQMLVSMVQNPLPTRAEVTDVANAVLDGTDAVMLSEETAIGHNPPGVLNMMCRLLLETEPLLTESSYQPSHRGSPNALAYAAAKLAEDLDAAAIIAPTRTGLSAQRLAAFRPRRPILAYSRVPETTRRLALVWGVTPVDLAVPAGTDPLAATLEAARRDLGVGTRVVVLDVNGDVPGVPSLVNAIRL